LPILRGLLFQQAHDSAGDLRRDSIEVTRENLKSALMFAVVYAKPKSDLVPWPLGDREASSMINVVVTTILDNRNDYQRSNSR
jgi:hypothetical protein